MRVLILVLLWLWPAALLAEEWRLVPGETRVEVDVDWRGRTVTLRFNDVIGEVIFDQQRPESAKASIRVDARTVSTGAAVVDAFVRGPEYLDVERHPWMDYRLDRLVQTSEQTADVFGRLTMFGQTRSVAFRAQVFRYGPTAGAPDRFDAGFNIGGSVDRRDFGHTTGLPEVAAVLPIRIRLLMRSD